MTVKCKHFGGGSDHLIASGKGIEIETRFSDLQFDPDSDSDFDLDCSDLYGLG
jgi:hypothetical protein